MASDAGADTTMVIQPDIGDGADADELADFEDGCCEELQLGAKATGGENALASSPATPATSQAAPTQPPQSQSDPMASPLVKKKGICDICSVAVANNKTPFCRVHKRTYDGLMRQASKQDARSKATGEKDEAARKPVKGKKKKAPVSQARYIKSIRKKQAFKRLMLRFESDCPGSTGEDGRGHYRAHFDMVSFMKRYSALGG